MKLIYSLYAILVFICAVFVGWSFYVSARSNIEAEARLQAIEDRIKSLETAANRTGGTESPLAPMADVIHPDDFTAYSSPYGIRRSPFTGELVHHTGLDLYGVWCARVLSPGDGVVVEHWIPPGQAPGFRGHPDLGGCIVLRLDDGAMVTIGHLSETFIKEGQRVSAGDVIGRQGSTGRSTSQHVHIEVTINGREINPASYLAEIAEQKTEVVYE